MKRFLDTDRWYRLGDLSFEHKALLLLLESVADPSGVVVWNPDALEALAGRKFLESDIRMLGEHRVIWLDHSRLLLPEFLLFQYSTLSRKCKGHTKVWKALRDHWPMDEDGQDTFAEAWEELKIGHLVPPMRDERLASQRPPWYLELEARVKKAMAVKIPGNFPTEVAGQLQEYFAFRERNALRQKNKTDADRWDWTPEQAFGIIKTVTRWLCEYDPHGIVSALEMSWFGNSKTPFEPKPKFKLAKRSPFYADEK